MKTKLKILLTALVSCSLTALAQDTPTPAAATTAQAKPAEAVAANPAAADPNEIVPTIIIEDASLTTAIQNLARQAGLNFQFDPRITQSNQPNISIRFDKVTAAQALQAVLENHNLTLVKDVRSPIARITVKDPKADDPLFTRIIQLKYTDPTNLIAIVKSSLGIRGQVVADPRTSQLIVLATEKELDSVTNTIAKLDIATRQVLIEGNIFETARNPSSVRGIDWSGTFEKQKVAFGNNLAAPDATPINGLLVGAPSTSKLLLDTAKGFNPKTAFLDADGVSAVISFLNKDSDSEVLSTPRAVTLDNQETRLSVTRAFPIFQVTPGSANSPAGATVTYTNLGTILSVLPKITSDNNIMLRVVPEVSNIDGTDTQVVNGQPSSANVYAIRRAETQVMVPSGHTLVLGGLISDSTTKSFIKVPLLGDAPGIGRLFRKETKTRNKSNLMIFITPSIVKDDDFQVAQSNFLKHRLGQAPEEVESSWDSGKPYDWTKPHQTN